MIEKIAIPRLPLICLWLFISGCGPDIKQKSPAFHSNTHIHPITVKSLMLAKKMGIPLYPGATSPAGEGVQSDGGGIITAVLNTSDSLSSVINYYQTSLTIHSNGKIMPPKQTVGSMAGKANTILTQKAGNSSLSVEITSSGEGTTIQLMRLPGGAYTGAVEANNLDGQ